MYAGLGNGAQNVMYHKKYIIVYVYIIHIHIKICKQMIMTEDFLLNCSNIECYFSA